MDRRKALEQIKDYIQDLFKDEPSGHDDVHMTRVASWAKYIAVKEDEDPFLCEVTALLHDVGDRKLFSEPEQAVHERDKLLVDLGFTEEEVDSIAEAIRTVSFSKGMVPNSRLGEIIQDADRLDAIGAIGIARAFAYGGTINQPIYKKDRKDAIDHFYEKLLKLKGLMITESGKQEAEKRHQFMLQYLEEFHREQACREETRHVTE
ncbi:HD domain-containing protein [Halobacillus sp. Nhm2S1]|uniref:HD domain-containing protein n=1 Tax=Halobacillus sp. Nhm2S1 TaxID=2866716 RepID=UPI001C7330D8|nr:HD domain-containing protein [Halobacillus sp. Nhm2S1]MBX0356276.1 HD domain-containing protein [Halobacillus sp. Nhm2S1]